MSALKHQDRFPPDAYVTNFLQNPPSGKHLKTVNMSSGDTDMLDYLSSEVLELAGNITNIASRTIVKKVDVQAAIDNDDELSDLVKAITSGSKSRSRSPSKSPKKSKSRSKSKSPKKKSPKKSPSNCPPATHFVRTSKNGKKSCTKKPTKKAPKSKSPPRTPSRKRTLTFDPYATRPSELIPLKERHRRMRKANKA